MKHKLLSLFAFLLVATSVGWAQQKESLLFEGTAQDVTDFKSYMGIKDDQWKGHIVYGHGYVMTIQKAKKEASDNQLTISFSGVDAPGPITIASDEHAIVFGGSKEADLVGNTSITLESGDVGYIIGGGWGTRGQSPSDPKTANVNNVSIDINGGSVGLIYSGGLYRSNVNDITLNIENAKVSHIYCGGFDQGQTSNTLDTEWASSVNRVRKSALMMVNSEVLGYLFLGGGQGYSYSQEVEATVTKSTLHCGLLGTGSNGRSDNVKITVAECTFAKASEQTDIIEIAPLNRGIIKDISMIFDNCTFPTTVSDYAAYLGATYAYDGKSKVELGKVDIQFKEGTNIPDMHISSGLDAASVTLTGTKAIVGETVTVGSTTKNTYTLAKDQIWTFNGGLEFADGATLTKTGTLVVKGTYGIETVSQLKEAITTIGTNGIVEAKTISMTDVLNEINKVTATTLPAGIQIVCKDARLFASKATAEACTETNLPVFYVSGDAGSYAQNQVLKAAEIYYVSSEATTSGSGLTAESPLMVASLEDAISKATKAVKLIGTFNKNIVLNKAITLVSADAASKATINGTIAIEADGATVENLNLAYQWRSSLYSDKIGISVFANQATIKRNTFTTSGGSNATNGIVFYPKTATADYAVEENTFALSVAGSTAIIVREDFQSKTQIPNVVKTAKLTNGAALDAKIVAAINTYTNVTSGTYYMRITGNYSVKDATGSGSEDITQKAVYAYVAQAGVADAIQSSQVGSTVKVNDTAANMLTKLNEAAEKTALANNITIVCSNETVYTDVNSAWAASTATKKAQYVLFTNQTYTLEAVAAQKPVITTNSLKASDVEIGQSLSVSLLSKGAATVDGESVTGVFTWKAPETKVEAEGPTSYAVVFTPTDALRYESVETTVSVKGIQYYTVIAGKCEHGKILVKEANAANRYKKGTTLTLTTVADAHYTFDAWTEGAVSYAVTKEAELKATFKAITRKVSFSEGVTVLNNGVAVANNASVIEGSVLTVTAAKSGNQLTALTCNNSNVINNTVTVADKDLTIAATFAAIPASTQLVTVDYSAADSKNGKVQLYDDKGNIIESGAAVVVGKKVSVVAVPDYGYVANTLTVTGAALTQSTFTVGSEAVTVKQTFKKATYKVTLPVVGTEHATVVLSSADLNAVPYLTDLTISSATPSDGYTLVSIIVNGKEVVVGGSFTVTADTKVNVVVKELPKIQFTDTKQVYTYTGENQAFVIRTIPAGIEDITVSYRQGGSAVTSLTDAGTYDVFASYSGKKYIVQEGRIGTLEIKKAQLAVAIPIPDQVGNGYTKIGDEGEKFQKVKFNLSNDQAKNYEDPTFIIPKQGAAVTSVTLSQPVATTSSKALRLATATITLKGINGRVEAYNGPTATKSAYGDQTITLKAIPDAGYSTIPSKWEVSTGTITDNQDGTATVTLPSSDATITATFVAKAAAPVTTGEIATGTYNGVVYGGATISAVESALQGWNLSFKQGTTTINEPITAGSYDMIASRSEDEAYAATTTTIGTLKIAKATASIREVKGSDIQVGDPLSKSVLSGVSDVEGTFAWTKDDQVMNTAGNDVKASVTFTSTNANYENTTGEATLKVIAKSADVKTRTLALTVNNPANGEAVKMTLDGTEVTSGVAVKEGGKLVVTFKANSGSTASAKINDAAYTSGSTYTIGAEGDVKVVVAYTKNTTPGGGDEGDDDDNDTPTIITIQLDAAEKTLKVGDEFTLKATVTGSTDKVAWTSSDVKVATVTDGKVKALKAGTATIMATVGQVKAECKVTVSAPTGLDEVLAKSRVYGTKGLIVIEPAATMQIVITNLTGYNFYANEISNPTCISVPAGIYLVSFSNGKEKITEKVSVR